MRHMIKATLLFTLACFYAAASLAQEGKPAGIAKRKFKHHGKIDSRYDPSTDKTTVVLNPYAIPPDATDTNVYPQRFSIMCGFTYKGRASSGRPATIEFHLLSDGSHGWKFDKEPQRALSATVDGERVEIGGMRLVSAKHYMVPSSPVNYGREVFLEELYIPLTYEGMLKIATGKRVLLSVGEQKIQLDDEHLEALRDLTSRMAP
ncbi:MAG: hypothetical protein ACJ74T_01390 [Pyrinomonadaceae bacterium]